MNSNVQLGTKRLGTVSRKKCQKIKQNKTFRFFNSFSQNSTLPRRFLMKKIFIVHEFKDSFGERLRKELQRGFFDINDQLVNFMLKYLIN